MKLKDIPIDKNVIGMKIGLTDELREVYENYSSKGESEIYLIGEMMGDWFISPDSPDVKRRTLYPMPLSVDPTDFLECEVMDNESL